MKNKLILFMLPFLFLSSLTFASTGQIKVHVAEFTVTGPPNRDELKGTLQTLLASRLNTNRILTVDSPSGAELQVFGSYTLIGGAFSLDAAVKNKAGEIVTRSFVQGGNQEELLPAVGKLAQALAENIEKASSAAPAVAPSASGGKDAAAAPVPSDIIKAPQVAKSAPAGNLLRLNGVMRAMAPGRVEENGEREIFIADNRNIRLYRLEKDLKPVAEVSVGRDEEILTIDTADLDKDGLVELYVTLFRFEQPASQVWVVKDNTFVKIADRLPYFFRAMAPAGGERKVYAQRMGVDDDFYGEIYELSKSGNVFETKNPIKLPRFGFLYNFNTFVDEAGRSYFIVMSPDRYLIVYSKEGEELWRSNEKFGGSETYFKRDDTANIRVTGDQYRWVYLEQRIVVTKDGEILIPQNAADRALGKVRSFRKSSVFSFLWNGATLEEKWRTRESQNSLSDFIYDDVKKELILLQVVKREGMVGKGASAVFVKKVE